MVAFIRQHGCAVWKLNQLGCGNPTHISASKLLTFSFILEWKSIRECVRTRSTNTISTNVQ